MKHIDTICLIAIIIWIVVSEIGRNELNELLKDEARASIECSQLKIEILKSQ